MTTTDRLISVWKLSPNGRSIPKTHLGACSELEAVRPDCPGQQSLDELICDNHVEINCSGEYILTHRGIQRRRNLPDAVELRRTPACRTGHEWDRFRKTIGYYIDCIQTQEHPQVYLGAENLDRKFLVPIFSLNWLGGLGRPSEQTIVVTQRQRPAMRRLLSRKEDAEEIFVGYPVAAFWSRTTRNTCYAPMGLIPVDILESGITTLKLRLRIDEAQVNRHWLEFAFPREESDGILRDILNLHGKDDPHRGLIDLREALPLLAKDRMRFDPDRCDVVLPRLQEKAKETQCNAPVLFVGDELKYSRSQKNELRYIRDQVPDEDLDRTALAYVFREPALECHKAEEPLMPLPFIESNAEQMAAVQSALNHPCTKITGPPGTGKSQVAVNIIANEIFNGRTVFFSSNNHKAVGAIRERAEGLFKDDGLQLVNFCTEDKENAWYMQDLDALKGACDVLRRRLDRRKFDQVRESIKRWRHIARKNLPRGEVLSRYEALMGRIQRLRERIGILFDDRSLADLSDRRFRCLDARIESLSQPVEFSLGHLWGWLTWRLLKSGRSRKAMAFLEENYPGLAHEDREELLRKFRECRPLFEKCSRFRRELGDCEEKARGLSSAEMERDRRDLAGIFRTMSECLVDALLVERIQDTEELIDSKECEGFLRSVMNFLREARSPYFFRRKKSQDLDRARKGLNAFLRCFPGWAATLKSLYRVSPCLPAVFDCVVVDEASQCDPASVIPALFRARRAVFMGDSNQFPPVITLKPVQNEFLKRKSGMTDLEDQRYDFMHVSAFDLLSEAPILLREHFRCAEEIAGFCNETFYAGRLCVRTDPERLRFPRCLGFRHAIEWIDVRDSREDEIAAVEDRIRRLLDNHYEGSIGVVSPYRKHANELDTRLYALKTRYEDEHREPLNISTAHGFQGGEKDVIFFVLGYVSSLKKGEAWYAEASEHRYIYNVAASRARACLIIVGDKERCARSEVAVLRNLAALPKPPRERGTASRFDSVWEEKFHAALRKEGIETMPQYPLLGRRLDLAYRNGDTKIDIEVDGVRYHTNSAGDRNMDDFYRDLQVGSQGWQVKRFWVHELRDDMPGCVETIRKMIDAGHVA